MNHKLMTYDEWVVWMTPKITWNGREWHNYGYDPRLGSYVEDWKMGERVLLSDNDSKELSINIPVDIRYIPIGNRNYSFDMWPEYIVVGALDWKYPTLEEMGWVNPPPPLQES